MNLSNYRKKQRNGRKNHIEATAVYAMYAIITLFFLGHICNNYVSLNNLIEGHMHLCVVLFFLLF